MRRQDSILAVKGVGEKTEKYFQKLGIETVEDLLTHYARDYDLYRGPQPIETCKEGQVCAIQGQLAASVTSRRVRNLSIVSIVISDGTGKMPVTWFQMPYLASKFKRGTTYLLRGKVQYKNGKLCMEHPKILEPEKYVMDIGKMMPIYPLTFGLTNQMVTKAMKFALENTEDLKDELSQAVRKRCDLITYKKALNQIHFPKSRKEYEEARRRLAFDEFYQYAKKLQELKTDSKIENHFPILMKEEVVRFEDNLPFTLTGGQQKVYEEILADFAGDYAMNRLVQGDVGSGKTMIAVLVLLLSVKNGYQGAFMSPTEVLAKQHFESLSRYLKEYQVSIELLTGSMTAKEKREAYARIKSGESDIVVGTHALVQDKVVFHNLALVITDEQHRFGVKQRETLYQKGNEPHVLAMSATPIPRTLALVLYGDMDLSVINELPANRLPIKNCVVGTSYRSNAYHFMSEEIKNGHQIYIICPMVEGSEETELESVQEYPERLKGNLPLDATVEILHGKMKPKQKNEIMTRFSNGEIQVLISTTVIEVGIDVPNATTIMIENSERFGLAQLHQLRGRVGRGNAQSYCILMMGRESREAKERLHILEQSNDGFEIAAKDLELRGQGDLFGVRQSGEILFKIADIYKDGELLQMASEEAKESYKSQLYKR